MSEDKITNIEKEITSLKVSMAIVETNTNTIIKNMPDAGSIKEKLKIHSWLIGIIIVAILSISFGLIKDKLI